MINVMAFQHYASFFDGNEIRLTDGVFNASSIIEKGILLEPVSVENRKQEILLHLLAQIQKNRRLDGVTLWNKNPEKFYSVFLYGRKP